MTDLRTAAQQALEALEGWENHDRWVWPESALEQAKRNTTESLATLRAALAQQAEVVQEPVAWRTFDGEGGYDYRTYEDNEDYAAEWAKRNPRHVGWVEPVYTAPPQRPVGTVQEPIAWMVYTLDGKSVCVTDNPADFTDEHRVLPLYTSPPHRKPLTEEDIQAAWDSVDMRHPRGNETRIAFARAVERAHGIKEGT